MGLKAKAVPIEPREDFGEPTPFRAQHGPIDVIHTPAFGVRRVRQQPIERYAKRQWIEPRQYTAATKLVEDYELGVWSAKNPEKTGSGRPSPISEATVMALRAYQRAVQFLGIRRCAIVLPVVCAEVDVSELAKQLKRPREGVMELLRDGLDELADHYGF